MDYSILLIAGALSALLMVNFLNPDLHHSIVDFVFAEDAWFGHMHDGHRVITVHWLINDVLMALFFAHAGTEVWEAIALRNGALHNPRRAATPIVATAGGVLGPVSIYLAIALFSGRFTDLSHGWAVPTATDIAFSYLIARIVFGRYHPAVKTLLTIALVDDLIGLIIIAFGFPQAPLNLWWMLLPAAVVPLGYVMRGFCIKKWYWYMPLGIISWIGFYKAGLHPALGLLPMVLVMPHADRDLGLFTEGEMERHDALSEFEHALKVPVEFVLFAFGFANAGVQFSAINIATIAILSALVVGKTVGIFSFAMLAQKSGLQMPEGISKQDLLVMSMVAAIGFTVALFMTEVSFPIGPMQDGAKMGALLSLGVGLIAIPLGWILGIRRVTTNQTANTTTTPCD